MISIQGPSSPIYILFTPILNSCPIPHSAPRQLFSPTQLVNQYQNTRREVARDALLTPILNGLPSFGAHLL